jgi:hypothetical protein
LLKGGIPKLAVSTFERARERNFSPIEPLHIATPPCSNIPPAAKEMSNPHGGHHARAWADDPSGRKDGCVQYMLTGYDWLVVSNIFYFT